MKNFFSNLRHDLPASIVVFFVALPLCLGIALASGAPLFSGIISGIIGGIIVGMISGSQLGVSGPAAGLAVIVFTYSSSLGSWESFLVAVVLAGLIQVIMGLMKLGNIAYYFPSSVIKGMLAGIGLIIMIKQIPHAIGYSPEIKGDFEEFIDDGSTSILQETISNISSAAIFISLISLMILIFWESFLAKKHKIFRIIPAPLFVVIIGILMGDFFNLPNHQIVQLPTLTSAGEIFSQFTFPNFEELKNPQIYSMALVIAIIASLETLLCVEATDKLDPLKRITPSNKELKAQGIGNIISGMIGGLPITQVIVRSSSNINFGAKTKLSTILHGFLLLLAVITIPRVLSKIPLASLASILLIIGYKLNNPKVFQKLYRIGFQQFAPFLITIIGMVIFDLLKGVGIGIISSICFILYQNFRNSFESIKDKEEFNCHTIILSEEVSFLNKGEILEMLNGIASGAKVIIDGSKSKNIDYDIIEIIKDFQISAKSKNIDLTTKGIFVNKIID
jgi:SulP family sulfate permease